MKIPFYKYQGTGNDFVIITNFFEQTVNIDSSFLKMIPKICERKWGVGSDGIILIEKSEISDFKMTFFNPDGSLSFCGNGARCAIKFASDYGIFEDSKVQFEAIDGLHEGEILSNDYVKLAMADISNVNPLLNGAFIDTGAPHYVEEIEGDIDQINLLNKSQPIRWHELFKPKGTNVNYIQKIEDNKIAIRTFEKGVENETLSCGTGITASVIYFLNHLKNGNYKVSVIAKGGELNVLASKNNNTFTNIKLIGKAIKVFKGEVDFE